MTASAIGPARLGRQRLRLPLIPAVVFALAVVIGAAAVGWLRPLLVPLAGTSLGATPAPGFRLEDYRGVSVSLDDFRGRPVVLSFMYSNCPDVCRLTAAGLKQTLAILGDDASSVALVAVTVDPAGDDTTTVRRFLGRYDLTGKMSYLVGPRDALPGVWADYHLFVGDANAGPGGLGLDAHTDAIFLIDRQGRSRSLLHSDFDPDELAASIRRLQREPI